jgi:hypothetical protein
VAAIAVHVNPTTSLSTSDPSTTTTTTAPQGEDTYTCFTCNTENVYLDLVTEMFLCRCGMEAMLAKAPDHPFKMTAGAR